MNGSSQAFSDPGAYRFGPFELDVREGELRKHGMRLKLQGKPCLILVTLLKRPGELVTREELRAALWGSHTFVDFEHGLDIAMNKLRAALGDSSESPRYVETVRGRGYRLVGAVTPIPAAVGDGGWGETLTIDEEKRPIGQSFFPAGPAMSTGSARRFFLGGALTVVGLAMLLAGGIFRPAELAQRRPPANPAAYEYFLRGQSYGVPHDYRISIQTMEKSVQLDPGYAPAWLELGQAYAGYADWQGGGAVFAQKSQAALEKALELDPGLPIARSIRAIQMMEGGELDHGLLALREELRIHPDEPLAHWWLTEAYLYGGMLDESIAEGERALRLDPLVNTGSTFNSYLHAGNYRKFLSTMPAGENPRTTFYRGLCFLYMGNSSQAATEFERAYAQAPDLLHAKYGKAFLYAIQKQPAAGLQYLKEVERTTATADGEMLYKMAQAYATLNDTPAALRLLGAAVDHDFYCHACFVRDPLLVSLHGDSQYAELLRRALDLHEKFRRQYF